MALLNKADFPLKSPFLHAFCGGGLVQNMFYSTTPHIIKNVTFEWDAAKASSNKKKHNVYNTTSQQPIGVVAAVEIPLSMMYF